MKVFEQTGLNQGPFKPNITLIKKQVPAFSIGRGEGHKIFEEE